MRQAGCSFCGIKSPECGALFTGVEGTLICEQCLEDGAVREGSVMGPPRFPEPDERTVDERAAGVAVDGPPPADEEASSAECEHAFQNRLWPGDDGYSMPYVEHGDTFAAARRQMFARFGAIAARVTSTVELVKFVNDHEAVLWWQPLLDDKPVLSLMEARMVRVDGQWKVTSESMRETFLIAGIHSPLDAPPPVTADHDAPVVRLEPWTGPWADDDPDANFKADVATYSHVDPLTTVTNLAGPRSTSRSARSCATCSRGGRPRAAAGCSSSGPGWHGGWRRSSRPRRPPPPTRHASRRTRSSAT